MSESASQHIDPVGKTWSNLRQRVFPRRRELTQMDEPSEDVDKLNVLATINEDVRGRCLNILERVDDLSILRTDFIEVFNEVGKLLVEAEGTSSTLLERTAILALEEKAHDDLKARHHELTLLSNRQADENNLLRSEAARFEELIAARECRIRALEQELCSINERATSLTGELDEALYCEGRLEEKLRAAEVEIEKDRELILEFQEKVVDLNDRWTSAEFQVKTLEATLSEARLQNDIALELSQQRHKSAIDEISNLKTRLDSQCSRADAAEMLLTESRIELQATADELRDNHIKLEQLRAEVTPMERSLTDASTQISSLTEQLADAEKSRALLADGAQALVRALTDERAKIEVAGERASLLERRLDSEATRFALERERLENKVRELLEQVEREKSARAITASALEAARSRFVQPDACVLDVVFDQAEMSELTEMEKTARKSRRSQTQLISSPREPENISERRSTKATERAKRIIQKPKAMIAQPEG
jgi:crescentin